MVVTIKIVDTKEIFYFGSLYIYLYLKYQGNHHVLHRSENQTIRRGERRLWGEINKIWLKKKGFGQINKYGQPHS